MRCPDVVPEWFLLGVLVLWVITLLVVLAATSEWYVRMAEREAERRRQAASARRLGG